MLLALQIVGLAIAAVVLYMTYSWAVVLLNLPRIRLCGVSRRARWMAAGMLILLGVANWVYLMVSAG